MDTRSPQSCPARRRRVLKKSSGALFSELLGSTVFIWPRAAVRHGTLRVVLLREAGAGAHGTRAGPRAVLSQEVGTRAAVTRGAPETALSREVGPGATVTRGGPRATLIREVRTGATVTCDAPGAALRREAGAASGAALSRSIIGCFW
jgi:hypothetical protein